LPPETTTTLPANDRSMRAPWMSCSTIVRAAPRPRHRTADRRPGMSKVRIAVAGAGLIGLRHIEEIGKSRGARLAAIVDVSPRAADAARSTGVPLRASLRELFAQDQPDGAILATPKQLHVEQGLECVAAGLPALFEKPVG